MVRSIGGIRISRELWEQRKKDKELIKKTLIGLNISEVDIDRIYAKNLKGLNILNEIFKHE